MQRLEEGGSVAAEIVHDSLLLAVEIGDRRGWSWWPEERQLLGEIEADSTIAFAERIEACPDDFASGDKRVEVCRLVAGDACGEDLGLEEACRKRRSLQVLDGVEQGVETAARLHNSLPAREEACKRALFDGLYFLAQLG